ATTRLVAALVEDIAETARVVAARSPGARLDPPLTLVLDEAANYRIPSLPSLVSEGGGSGICTVVVLQSLAQARAVWGEHEGTALWDAAIVKIILGGGSSARDLEDMSRLIGTRREKQVSTSRGPDGKKSWSASEREVPILEPAALRQLPFGQAVMLLRSAPAILLELQAWTKRKDAAQLRAGQVEVERLIRSHAEHQGAHRAAHCAVGVAGG
ncbi:MAG TPA: TraG/TraD/VirD4 family protein, partial [Jatrophihabitans sp.]|nr:TraG/TraD/VirD4 family protein [Jatrophihabitans sp.]